MSDSAVVKEVKVKFTASMAEYNKAVKQAQNATDQVRQKIEQISNALEKSAQAPAKQMAQWQRELKSVGTAMDGVDRRMGTLIASQRQLERSIETETQGLARAREEYQRLQQRLNQTSQVYAQIKSAAAGLDLSTPLEEQYNSVTAVLDQYAEEINQLEERIAAAQGARSFISMDDGSIYSLEQARDRVQQLTEQAERADVQAQKLRSAMKQIGAENIGSASTAGLQSLQAEIQRLQNDLSALGEKSAAMANRLTTDGERLQGVTGEMSELQGKTAQLSQSLDGIGTAGTTGAGRVIQAFTKVQAVISKAMDGLKAGAAKVASGFGTIAGKLMSLSPGTAILKGVMNRLTGVRKESTSTASELSSVVKQIRNIQVVSLGLNIAKGIFGQLRSVISTYTSENEAASEAVSNLRSAFANALAPAINVVINLLQTLLPYIQKVSDAFAQLVTNLFGSGWTTLASGASSAAEAVSDLADAQGDLEGFDEINKLSDDSSGSDSSSGSSGSTTSDLAMPGWLTGLQSALSGMFDVLQDAWAQSGEGVISAATAAFNSLKTLALDIGNTFYDVFTSGYGFDWATSGLALLQSMLGVVESIAEAFDAAWTSGRGTQVVSAIFTSLTNINNLLASIGESFSAAWSSGIGVSICEHLLDIITGINNIVGNLASSIQKAWDTAGLGEAVWSGILSIVDTIAGFYDEIVTATAEWAANINFAPALQAISKALESINTFANLVKDALSWVYENVLLPLGKWTIEAGVPAALDAIAGALDLISAVGAKVGEYLSSIWNNFLAPAASFAGDAVSGFLTVLGNVLSDIASNETIVTILSAVATAILAIVAAITAWNVVQAILNGLMLVFNSTTALITIIIVAVIAAIVLLVTYWDEIVGFFSGVWEAIVGFFSGIGEWFSEKFTAAKDAIVGAWDKVTDFFSGIWDGIKGVFSGIGSWIGGKFTEAKENAYAAWENTKTFFSNVWSGISGVFSSIGSWFSKKFTEAKDNAQTAWSNTKSFFSGVWSGISGVFSNVGSWFSNKFTEAKNNAQSAWSGTSTFFSGVWTNIKGTFSNVSGWFKDTFSAAWEKVKNVFSSGGKVFSGITEGILSGLKNVINKLIQGINKVVAIPFNGINTALNTLRELSILGLKPFSWISTISVPQIPQLASGAVIPANAPFAAILGDQTNGRNLELPESLLRQIVREESGGKVQTITIQLLLDGRIVGKTSVDYINGQYSQGLNPLNI